MQILEDAKLLAIIYILKILKLLKNSIKNEKTLKKLYSTVELPTDFWIVITPASMEEKINVDQLMQERKRRLEETQNNA